MSRRARRYAKAAISVIALVLIAAACSSSGFPESYDAQPNDEGVSNVEQNWLDGCTVGFEESDLAQDANTICACSFREIKASIPYDDFVSLNGELRNDPSSLTSQVAEKDPIAIAMTDIVRDCIASS